MNVTVVHAGALGDRVMVWPLVRALGRAGHSVRLVCGHEAAAHTAREINAQVGRDAVTPESIERPLWSGLWRGTPLDPSHARHEADLLCTFIADGTTPAGRVWLTAASRACPHAEVLPIGPPGTDSRICTWHRFHVDALGQVGALSNPEGPLTLCVGAGGEAKRWPLECWSRLADGLVLQSVARSVRVIAGPVERERFNCADHALFASLEQRYGGGFAETLDELSDALRISRMVVSADSGPAHLAAQLGLPTIALFGPTDPGIWKPVGPDVLIVAPDSHADDMSWLTPESLLQILATQQPLRQGL